MSGQDAPDAAELLEAVAEYLFAELRPEVPSEQRFRVLVAANICAVVARELRAGEGPALADDELFRELLGGEGDSAELARRIRAGEFDGDLDRLAERLSEHVRRTVQIRDGRTSTEVLRRTERDDSGAEVHVAEEFAVLDRTGRLQLPEDFVTALDLRDRVRLALETDHVGVWPDGVRPGNNGVTSTAGSGAQPAAADGSGPERPEEQPWSGRPNGSDGSEPERRVARASSGRPTRRELRNRKESDAA